MPSTATASTERGSASDRFTAVFERAGAKDRANMQRHLDALAALPAPAHVATWKSLLTLLGEHAPHSLQAVGQDAVRFFAADGRYRLQLFALEDRRDGQIFVYLPNVLEQALRKKLILAPKVENEYGVPGHRGETLRIEALDAQNTMDAAAHFKYMIGLNRRALRLTIPAVGRPELVELIGSLGALAAVVNTAADTAGRAAAAAGTK